MPFGVPSQAVNYALVDGRATLGLLEPRPGDQPGNQTLVFALNPHEITRSTMPVYAMVGVAGADYGPGGTLSAPFQWTRNTVEEIQIEFLLDAGIIARKVGDRYVEHVEDELFILEGFMRKDNRYKAPPKLVFAMGQRHDTVQIFMRDVREKIHLPNLKVRQAQVRLKMMAIKSRI